MTADEKETGQKDEDLNLHTWLRDKYSPSNSEGEERVETNPTQLEANTWQEIRLFLSSSFVDTQGERDVIIKRVIPSLNRRIAPLLVRITAVDLRWGVLAEESKDCRAIQKTCLNQVEACKLSGEQSPWFLGLRTQRYGWVQDEYLGSDGLNQPQQFSWLEELSKLDKHVSITSLECLHAGVPPVKKTVKPVVFFYQRNIVNEAEVEPNLRWVFEYEYVPEDAEVDDEVKFQYSKTQSAKSYEDDRNNLDLYLQNSDHITYRKYDCVYKKGGAIITGGGGGRKMFGVGYVTGLEQFEKQMEQDLYEAVISNFNPADLTSIKPHELENIPFENAVKDKAASFVGRTELVQKCYEYSLREMKDVEDGSNVMIIHGDPGCGKSALAAALSMKYIQNMRNEGHFVFIHAVDTCPNSNSVTAMINRLHRNLKQFLTGNSTDDTSKEEKSVPFESPSDMKQNHVQRMEEFALNHPDRLFIVLIDAVNQFNPALQAHSMWWVPSAPPKNLRIVITTLTRENSTFANACKQCPHAHQIQVESMSLKDGELMVSELLAKYNKKLTTTDEGFLGNQMQKVLEKSLSPLYLTATTQALRTFGIFEKLTPYIESLPNTIPELFKFLLNGWKEEYGSDFVRDVLGIIYLSKDGILENTINDVLAFIESTEGTQYECSFSRIYDSLKGFLAAGGGGQLRFFHDQLNKVVADVLIDSEVERRLHGLMAGFYLTQISPQLCEFPTVLPPAYYSDCLTRIVHHKINSIETKNEAKDVFTYTLRDIYFVRERVKLQQQDALLQEYVVAIQHFKDPEELKALKHWKKFVLNYIGHIAKYPESSYSMGIQQFKGSYVALDSQRYSPCASAYGFAPVWTNTPDVDDAIEFKYHSLKSGDCFVTHSDVNLVASSGGGRSFLYEADSGVLLHEFASGGSSSVYISTHSQTVWAGSSEGEVSVWNISNGDAVWKEQMGIGTQKTHLGRDVKDYLVFIGNVGEGLIGTCSRKGLISIVEDALVFSKKKSWNTQQDPQYKYEETFSCSFHEPSGLIATGHQEIVKFWDIEGNFMRNVTVRVEGSCQHLSLSPTADEMLVGFYHYKEEDHNSNLYRSLQCVNTTSGENMFALMDVHGLVAAYHPKGEVFVTLTKDMKTLLVYSSDGKLRHKLDGHDDNIRSVCFVPGRDELVTAADDGSVLFNVPLMGGETTMTDKDLWKEHEEKITSCGLLHTGEEFFTFDYWGDLSVYNVATSERIGFIENMKKDKKGRAPCGGAAVAHPSRKVVLVHLKQDIYTINATNCKIVSHMKVSGVSDIKISPVGDKCVVACSPSTTYVFHITEKNALKRSIGGGFISDTFKSKEKQITYEKAAVASCDINREGTQVVNGGFKGIFLWDLNTGKEVKALREMKEVKEVRFLYTSGVEQVMFCAGSSRTPQVAGILDMEGTLVRRYDNVSNFTLLHNNQRFVELSNVLRVYDLATGEVVYTFVDHKAKEFKSCVQVNNTILGFNENGIKYVLEYQNQ